MRRLIGLGVVVVSALVLFAEPAAAAPSATLTPAGGPPGTSVAVKGAGFPASTSVAVFFDTVQIALAVSNANGAVSVPTQIPMWAQPGKHWITLDSLSNHTAAQAAFSIVVGWPQFAWGPSWRGFNPYENTIGTGNAAQLSLAWSRQVTPFSNPKPFVDAGGNLFVFDENEKLHAYSQAGKLLWTATPGTTFRFGQAVPVAFNGNVYVGDSTGQVVAYKVLCRTDGGVCSTPLWSVNIGTAVNGGLTASGGLIYAPGADGKVHVLKAATGAGAGTVTPFFSGPVTQPVSVGVDGTRWLVQSNAVSAVRPGGGGAGSALGDGASVSAVTLGSADGYATATDGNLYQEPGGWSTLIGTTGCNVAPVFANGVVYAAGCNSIGAYEAGSGAAIWSISIPQEPSGLAIANGVLYVCWGSRLRAYYASFGVLIGTIGLCTGPAEIAMGTVYTTDSSLFAYTLTGVFTSVWRPLRAPDPALLELNSPTLPRGAVRVGGLAQQR